MRTVFILSFLIFCANYSGAQKITIESKVDEFTGSTIITSSNLSLYVRGLGSETISYRVQKIDSNTILRIAYGTHDVFSVPEGGELMLLLDNKETFTVYSVDYDIAEPNFSAGPKWSARLSYISVADPQLKILEKNKVTKIRFYFTGGFREYEIKPKMADILMKAVTMVNTKD